MLITSMLVQDGNDGSDRLFRKLMKQVAVVAGITHVAFGLLFYWHQVPWLSWVNVFSVLLYVLVFWLMRTDRNTFFAWLLVVGEIVAHAVLAVTFVGWDSGFHFYIMLIPPVVMVSPLQNAVAKMPAVIAVVAVYVALDYSLREANATYAMPPAVQDSLYYFNLVAVLAIMVFLAGLYYRLVVRNERKLQRLATTDALTGLHNRRSLTLYATDLLSQTQPLTAILCDLDNFKRTNDEHGHLAGDQVLITVARLLRQSVRSRDLAARWGGEEFLLLLPETSAAEAAVVAERIRQRIDAAVIEMGGTTLPVSATLGVAERKGQETLDQLLARADEALYQGKHAGRNRIVCMD
ncbi:GGDEF domain-containing protein [Bacterioplanes sanyensis]|nr:GGDEF domain-containing protein [Bacterioplanes sanyensis]